MLFVVQRYFGGVQVQDLPDFVRHVRADAVVRAIVDPDLEELLLGPQRQAGSDDVRLLELLTYTFEVLLERMACATYRRR